MDIQQLCCGCRNRVKISKKGVDTKYDHCGACVRGAGYLKLKRTQLAKTTSEDLRLIITKQVSA